LALQQWLSLKIILAICSKDPLSVPTVRCNDSQTTIMQFTQPITDCSFQRFFSQNVDRFLSQLIGLPERSNSFQQILCFIPAGQYFRFGSVQSLAKELHLIGNGVQYVCPDDFGINNCGVQMPFVTGYHNTFDPSQVLQQVHIRTYGRLTVAGFMNKVIQGQGIFSRNCQTPEKTGGIAIPLDPGPMDAGIYDVPSYVLI
jgi:hypothetical protein